MSDIQKFEKKQNWISEANISLETLAKSVMTINRIRYVGKYANPKKPKRCLSITKNGKSVAFDIEMAKAVAASLHELGDEYCQRV